MPGGGCIVIDGGRNLDISAEQLEEWLKKSENENIEFKEAASQYDFQKLVDYCVALANEKGGCLVLGVSDSAPRKVTGTEAYRSPGKVKEDIFAAIGLRVGVHEIDHPDGRVVVFEIPGRLPGVPLHHKGRYFMRIGEQLQYMTNEQLRRIFAESTPDFSAEICPGARTEDLNAAGVRRFRELWASRSGKESLLNVSDEKLLSDAELIRPEGISYAALILFGTHGGLGKHLGQAEVIFEYRSSEASISYSQREEYRLGFFLFFDQLWSNVNLRNDVHQYLDGLYRMDIPTFNEAVVREALLNAITHRDYRLQGSVFVRQYPHSLVIDSPGGFPPGVTPDNILTSQVPRNKRIAETFQRCGLVERAGQGVDRMFEKCILESKPTPDYSGSDDYKVSLVLIGEVQDERFLRFLERVGNDTLSSFTTEDLLLLDLVHREQPIPDKLKPFVQRLKDKGIVEKTGIGRGTRHILSRAFYEFLGETGRYTRRLGLDRGEKKALLEKHIGDYPGCKLADLRHVLPELTRTRVQNLLQELKREKRVHPVGSRRGASWYPGPPQPLGA